MVQTTPTPDKQVDSELEQFRGLMTVPSSFDEGFNWKSLVGAVFIAMLMVPGAIYMDLLAGQQGGMQSAAQWVTVILFVEVARRAQQSLKKSEIYILFYMASMAVGVPFQTLLWYQYYIRSQAAQATGIAMQIPRWIAPPLGSLSYAHRSFMSLEWLPAIGFLAFTNLFGNLSNMVLGYGLFRLTSDIERLPFPMAPVGAQGILALAEDSEEKAAAEQETSWRWRVFSIGGALGLGFGALYLLLPTVTGALTGTPIQLFTIPFVDTTAKTQAFLPAVATGLSWDLGNLLTGMVFPFFAMVGSFIALVITIIANPILLAHGMLPSWRSGDDTIATLFKNNIDFYFSFTIGISIAVAIVGIYQIVTGLRRRQADERMRGSVKGLTAVPAGRGDIRPLWIMVCYFFVTMTYITVSGFLINWDKSVLIVLFILGFVITPLMSYVSARVEGMAGQAVEIPMVREACLILSGFRGVQVWFLPLPYANYGSMCVFYRQCELTGTKFSGIWKTQLILSPIILISSFFFMNFIWGLAEVPSAVYPYAQKMWELNAANMSIMYSSTLGDFSIFQQAFKPDIIAAGAGIGVGLFAVLGWLGAPLFLIYGVVRGLGNPMPHYILPQMLGACLGRFYFQRKLGVRWRQYIPVVLAGFTCGMGLVTVLGVGFTFLSKAAVQLPI